MSDELDDLLGDTGDDEDFEGGNPANNKRLSDALHRESKAKSQLEKKLAALEAELEKRDAERRDAVVSAAAKELGIKDKHIGFYTGEADLAAIKQWAVDNEFISGEGDMSSDEKDKGFEPGGIGGNDSGAGTGLYSAEEVARMYFEGDAAKALKLLQAGKVKGISSDGEVDTSHPDYDLDYGGQYRYQ